MKRLYLFIFIFLSFNLVAYLFFLKKNNSELYKPEFAKNHTIKLDCREIKKISLSAKMEPIDDQSLILKNNNHDALMIDLIKNDIEKRFIKAINNNELFEIDDLKELRNIYISTGNIDNYIDLLNNIPDSYQPKDDIICENAFFFSDNYYDEESLNILKFNISKNPDSIQLRLAFADILYLTGELEESIIEYKKVIEVSENPYACFNLGKVYIDVGDIDKANHMFIQSFIYSNGYEEVIKNELKDGGIAPKDIINYDTFRLLE